ncbi:MAG: 30S ribosomal protein S8 [Pseudomonadota bacterium]
MSMTDPIADMLTRIRNGLMVDKKSVRMPSSKIKVALANVLLDEGYLSSVDAVAEDNGKASLTIGLKYFQGAPVIEQLKRASRPGLRLYSGATTIPNVWDGLGTVIVSTSKGVMTDKNARKINQGGEVLCYVA